LAKTSVWQTEALAFVAGACHSLVLRIGLFAVR